MGIYKVTTKNGDGRDIRVPGRNEWALRELIRAGEKGCTPIDNPAPRWSGYIHNLRREYDLDIETISERHDGPYPGNHARYVLHSKIETMEVADGE